MTFFRQEIHAMPRVLSLRPIRRLARRKSLALLAIFAVLQGHVLSAFAQLPTQADPDSGAVRDGNVVDAVKFYAKDIFIVAGLIIATVVFVIVTTNAIAIYKEIRDGRRTWGDLGMHVGAGAILIVFVVFLLTQAQDIIV
jgi:integrating conjugative element membrane protein (TIGR03745 family)